MIGIALFCLAKLSPLSDAVAHDARGVVPYLSDKIAIETETESGLKCRFMTAAGDTVGWSPQYDLWSRLCGYIDGGVFVAPYAPGVVLVPGNEGVLPDWIQSLDVNVCGDVWFGWARNGHLGVLHSDYREGIDHVRSISDVLPMDRFTVDPKRGVIAVMRVRLRRNNWKYRLSLYSDELKQLKSFDVKEPTGEELAPYADRTIMFWDSTHLLTVFPIKSKNARLQSLKVIGKPIPGGTLWSAYLCLVSTIDGTTTPLAILSPPHLVDTASLIRLSFCKFSDGKHLAFVLGRDAYICSATDINLAGT